MNHTDSKLIFDAKIHEIKKMVESLEQLASTNFVEANGNSDLSANLPVNVNVNHIDELKDTRATIYGEHLIVMQNRLVTAISDLNLMERRLIMFLSPLVRKSVDTNPNQKTFAISAIDFMKEYGIEKNKNAYAELSQACSALTQKSYSFWDFSKNSRMVSKDKKVKHQVVWFTMSVYQDGLGEVHVDLHDEVINMLSVFDKANPFTKYERQLVVNLGCYGIILFNLVASCMHQKHKKKGYTIEYLREVFNCIETYPRLTDFRKRVIDSAIANIHEQTPYRIKYEVKKNGRVATDLIFSFEDQREKETKKSLKNIENKSDKVDKILGEYTDKQLARIVNSQKFIADYGELVSPSSPANQSSGAWKEYMTKWVKKEPNLFNKKDWKEYLDDEQAQAF